jgi:hypothetical protein
LWKKQIPTNIFFIELIFNVGCTLYFGHLEPSNNDVVEYTNCINKNAKHNFDLLATIKTSMNELNPHGWIIMESSSSSSSFLIWWVLFLAVTNDFGHVIDLYYSLLTKTGPKPKNKRTITPLSLSLWALPFPPQPHHTPSV